MAFIKKRKIGGAEIPTSSMADIAFLLLLFFLVATVIDVDTGLGISLPEFIDNPETVEVPKDRMAAVLINENGDVLLNGNLISIPQIKSNLKPRIISKIDLPASKKLIVSLKTDRKTNYNKYIQTLDQIKMAFFEARDDYSNSRFGKKFNDISKDQQEEIKEKVPIIISIAEPEQVKK